MEGVVLRSLGFHVPRGMRSQKMHELKGPLETLILSLSVQMGKQTQGRRMSVAELHLKPSFSVS